MTEGFLPVKLKTTSDRMVQSDPLGDSISHIELVAITNLIDNTVYYNDQMPLLAARISTLREGKTGQNKANDLKLLSETLAQNKHMTPFEHIVVTFRVVAPIMVFREWHRHRTQSYNELSMRYVRAEDADSKIFRFYIPKEWRLQAIKNKQGSLERSEGILSDLDKFQCDKWVNEACNTAKAAYLDLARKGIASELCRLVLPVATYSEMYATANLRNWYQFYELRADEAAQWEIRQYALAIGKMLGEWLPESWSALSKWKTVGLSNDELDTIVGFIKAGAGSSALTPFGESLVKKLEKVRRRP